MEDVAACLFVGSEPRPGGARAPLAGGGSDGGAIEILVDRLAFRRWHLRLADRLATGGAEVRFRAVAGPSRALPPSVEALVRLEKLVLRRGRETLWDRLALPGPDRLSPPGFRPATVVDCSGRDGPVPADRDARTLRPLFDGSPAEESLVAALLAQATPEIAVEDAAQARVLLSGRPGGGLPGLVGALEATLSRTGLLLERAALRPAAERSSLVPVAGAATRERRRPSAAAYAARNIAADGARAIFHLCFRAPHWRVGWRWNDGPGVIERGDLGGPAWTVLRDAGRSFYADPFPVTWEGRTFVFVEEFDYRVGHGVISAVEFGPAGPVGRPFVVLHEPWHLSYPFVMEHRGALYMIPEASVTATVPLYRCTAFPSRWERVGSLLEGVDASDATVFAHDGLLWMTATTRDGYGGWSDTLSIHHAGDLLGPWTEHAERPAAIDAGLARPAGRVVKQGGRLLRPVQDCRKGYGLGLRIASIDRLDTKAFRQTLRATVAPGPSWPGRRLHSINRDGRLELIDGATRILRSPLHGHPPGPTSGGI